MSVLEYTTNGTAYWTPFGVKQDLSTLEFIVKDFMKNCKSDINIESSNILTNFGGDFNTQRAVVLPNAFLKGNC
jgi:hypothetical protein